MGNSGLSLNAKMESMEDGSSIELPRRPTRALPGHAWARANLMKFSKAKCKVLNQGHCSPKHKYRLGGEWIESSPEVKDLGVLVDEKINMTRRCALAT